MAADEAVAAEAAAKSEAQKAEVEADLDEAMPALTEALGALDTLSAKDIGEIKAMKNPPGPAPGPPLKGPPFWGRVRPVSALFRAISRRFRGVWSRFGWPNVAG